MGSCVSVVHHHNNKNSSGSSPSADTDKVQMSSLEPFDPHAADNKTSSIPSTPIKDNNMNNNNNNPVVYLRSKSQVSPFHSLARYSNYGSKDEGFYDTQAWLESDCEDDFYSVGGDFSSRGSTPAHSVYGTPRHSRVFSPQVNRALFDGRRSASTRSRGSTPIHHRSISSSGQTNGRFTEGAPIYSPDIAPKPKSKKLSDLFRESIRERPFVDPTIEGYETEINKRLGTSPRFPPLPPKSANRTPSISEHPSRSKGNGKRTSAGEHSHSPQVSLQRCLPRLVPRSLSLSSRSSRDKKSSAPPTPSSSSKSLKCD